MLVSQEFEALPRWIGPFWIVKRIGVVACNVQLPNIFKIHSVLDIIS